MWRQKFSTKHTLIIQLALKYQISNDFPFYKFYISGEPIYISLTNVSVCHMSNCNLIGIRVWEDCWFSYFIFLFIIAITLWVSLCVMYYNMDGRTVLEGFISYLCIEYIFWPVQSSGSRSGLLSRLKQRQVWVRTIIKRTRDKSTLNMAVLWLIKCWIEIKELKS